MINENLTASYPLRAVARILCIALLLVTHQAPLFADARSDGEQGIEAFKRGDLIESMELLERSARGGYAPAQVTLAYILDISERDEEAFKWYQEAASAGDPAGIFGLASMYEKGEGVERDRVKAGELTRRAAELDYLLAMRAYAYALENGGLGFERDPAAALDWFRRTAEAGDQVAMSRLKEAYSEGQLGLPVDPEKAAYWEAKIMNQGE